MLELGASLNIASLGYDIYKDILEYHRRLRDCRTDVANTCILTEQLKATFSEIHDIVANKNSQFTVDQIDLLLDSLESCNTGLDRLAARFQKNRLEHDPKDLHDKVKNWLCRGIYPLRTSTLHKTIEAVSELTSNLSRIVAVLNM